MAFLPHGCLEWHGMFFWTSYAPTSLFGVLCQTEVLLSQFSAAMSTKYDHMSPSLVQRSSIILEAHLKDQDLEIGKLNLSRDTH